MAQGDGSQIGCRITVDGTSSAKSGSPTATTPQTFCLVKSA